MAVLLIDDNDFVLELQTQMLERYGLVVHPALSGKQAFRLASEQSYELIMLDMDMPGVDGFAMARQLREIAPETPIFALVETGIASRATLESAGINELLVKPLELHKLQEAINTYIQLDQSRLIQWKRKTDILFDFEKLCDTIGGPRAALNIICSFLHSHGRDGKVIADAIRNREYDKAGNLLHDIVSISGIMNCHRLYNTAFRMNANLKNGSQEGLEYFTAAWLETVAKLSDVSVKLSAMFTDPPVVDERDWTAVLSDFIELSSEYDVVATELFNRNKAAFAEHFPPELYEAVDKLANLYDYSGLQKLLEEHHVQSADR